MSGLTPEGKVKKRVTIVLQRYGSQVYSNMPVPNGYGESMLDYVGCVAGSFFAIETKAPGKRPTDRQTQCRARMERAGARVFIIDSVESPVLGELDAWIREQLDA